MDGISCPENSLTLFLVPPLIFDYPGVSMFRVDKRDIQILAYTAPEKGIIKGCRADEDIRLTAQELFLQFRKGSSISCENIMLELDSRVKIKTGLCPYRAVRESCDMVPSVNQIIRKASDNIFHPTSQGNIMSINGNMHGVIV